MKITQDKTPVNKQTSILLSRHRRCETVQEALDGGINHLLSGKINQQLADAFSGVFGDEPWVTFKITIRRDPKDGGKFVYKSSTQIAHQIGEAINLYGLKP